MDSAAIAIAFFTALVLTGQMSPDGSSALQIAPMLAVLVAAGSAASWWIGLPLFTLNAYDIRGVTRTAAFAATCGVLSVGLDGLIVPSLSMPVHVNFALLLLVLCATWRIALRQVLLEIYRRGQTRMRFAIQQKNGSESVPPLILAA